MHLDQLAAALVGPREERATRLNMVGAGGGEVNIVDVRLEGIPSALSLKWSRRILEVLNKVRLVKIRVSHSIGRVIGPLDKVVPDPARAATNITVDAVAAIAVKVVYALTVNVLHSDVVSIEAD